MNFSAFFLWCVAKSREDRKLISYVKVIEKLEKQGKRKKELKQQRAAAAAAAAASQSVLDSTKASNSLPVLKEENGVDSDSDSKRKPQSSTDSSQQQQQQIGNISSKSIMANLIPQIEKNDNTKSSLLRSMEQVVDQEIADINEKGALANKTNRTNMPHTESATTAAAATLHGDLNKPTVKSPDYSFVNVSIQPRQTLNLIQRNLSTPAAYPILDYEQPDNDFKPQLNLLSNNNLPLFNPKKYWLKCSTSTSVDATTTSSSLSGSMLSPSTPLKKRRHAYADEHSNSSQNNDEFVMKEEPITDDQDDKFIPANNFETGNLICLVE